MQIIIPIFIIASLFYFWQRSRVHGLHWIYVVFAYIFWPIGALVGAYWAISDLCFYYRGKPLISTKSDDDSKYSLRDKD